MNWMRVWNTLQEFNEFAVIARIFLAMLLGGIIGSEREKSKRPAGFRTHILVCVGACMTSLIGMFVFTIMGGVTDPVRISAQVISGIGFLGVGTILVKERDHITGLTTAAGLWTTAAIGISCGYGFYTAALIGTLVVTMTSAILFKLETGSRKKNRIRIVYLEVTGTECLNEYTDWFVQELQAKSVRIVPPRSAISGNVGMEVILSFLEKEDMCPILEKIRDKECVVFAMESVQGDTVEKR